MNSILRYLHWINFDTALGAAITSLFIADCLGTEIPVVAVVTLFIAVLSIYNFDHLMDARRVHTVAKSKRHRFYQQHLRLLSIYQLILIFGLIIIIWYLPTDILRAGLILALVTGIYFILLFFIFPNKFLLKEIMIAAVYSLALFLAPVYTNNADTSWLVLWLQILILAIANTLIFAWYDYEIDVSEGHTSLAGNLGKKSIYRMIMAVLGLSVFLVVYQLLITGIVFAQIIILIMTLVLLFSLLAHKYLSRKELYRVVGDAVFLIPAITFLI